MDQLRKIIRRSIKRMEANGRPVDFFELLRRCEQGNPDKPRVGNDSTARNEYVRLGQMPFLKFPETEISKIVELDDPNQQVLVLVYFMGLLGVNGPLPLELTDFIYQRALNHYDHAPRRFLDIINHRFISLFYRAFVEGSPAVGFDRPAQAPVKYMLGSLSGIPAVDGYHASTYAPAAMSGYMCMRTGSVSGLRSLLYHYFDTNIRVYDLTEHRNAMPPELYCRIGHRDTCTLGASAQIGAHYLTVSGLCILELGPVPFSRCVDFFPGGKHYRDLCSMVEMYLQKPTEYDIVFLLRSETVPTARLNSTHALGRNSFLAWGATRPQVTRMTINASRLNRGRDAATLQRRQ
ncbi:MAG: type VI secretion system baseplate subunit TssG [Succinivibrionaceae bacterium]|nr:type VI secretion system baseplate subunit TssG [Succinivibrionaceae bacterium]